MSQETNDSKPSPDTRVALDEDQLDQVSGGSGVAMCKTHNKVWPCPVIVNGAACPGPKYTPIMY
jgi:hypothetical protein